jgi:hypothetical protein
MSVNSGRFNLVHALSRWVGAIGGGYLVLGWTGMGAWLIEQERCLFADQGDQKIICIVLGSLLLAFSPQIWEGLRRAGMVGAWPFGALPPGEPYRAGDRLWIHPRFWLIMIGVGFVPAVIAEGIYGWLVAHGLQDNQRDYHWIPAIGSLLTIAIWGIWGFALRKTIKVVEG